MIKAQPFPSIASSMRLIRIHIPAYYRASRPLLYSTRQTTKRTMADTPKAPLKDEQTRSLASHSSPPVNIKWTNINTSPGVELSPDQKLLVGSVLDLFEGRPTLKHFDLWSPTGTFTDPLSVATGAARYKAQWYGLPALFHPIQILEHKVTTAGNPIEMELRNKYTLKGLKSEQAINSVVVIHVDEQGKIDRVEDRWNGKLPSNMFLNAFRKLNGAIAPTLVTVPKTEEEDLKMQRAREGASS